MANGEQRIDVSAAGCLVNRILLCRTQVKLSKVLRLLYCALVSNVSFFYFL